MAHAETTKLEVGDSAPSPVAPGANQKKNSRPKGKNKGGNKEKGKSPNTSGPDPTVSSTNTSTHGYSEGNTALLSYGLSVSGRKERILSPFKADKFFHFVEQSYKELLEVKPHIGQRFSYAEFRHASALQLYSRLEQVKFDALGVKPSAPTRIPLPRNLKVFQPLWSVLANIGTVTDDDLRVQYIPDGILPETETLDSETDIENLITCTLYDWQSSWENVKKQRSNRPDYLGRDGISADLETNEQPELSRDEIVVRIQNVKKARASTEIKLDNGTYVSYGAVCRIPIYKKDQDGNDTNELDDELMKRSSAFKSLSDYDRELTNLFTMARSVKEKKITIKRDVSYSIDSYQISDGVINANAGAYGAWLHWDPQLWLDYEKFVEELRQSALFSMSMPVDTEGTYAWVLPVESTGEADVFCKLPKASIPGPTWILALLLQSSTLTLMQRSTFYTETDRLANVIGLRARYIRGAIKRAAPVEQYGTY
jgi:hypothetical protein